MTTVLISVNTTWNVVNFRAGLIQRLLGLGFKVVVASPPDEHVQALLALGESCDALHYEPFEMAARGTNPIADTWLLLRYRALIKRIKPDVFLGYTIKPNIFGSLAAHFEAVPVINNISGLGAMFIHRHWMTSLVRGMYRQALLRSHTVFFQNQDDCDLFLSGKMVRKHQCALLPGSGINLSHFQTQPWPNADGECRFLFVGRMLWEKGIGEYVQAAAMVLEGRASHQAFDNFEQSATKAQHTEHAASFLKPVFQVLGARDAGSAASVADGQWRDWQAKGLIVDLGTTNDVRPMIARAHCVVLPSYREGTPRALLEAAAMARPIIASRVPGCVNVVSDQVNGLLCEVRNPKSLAQCMNAFLGMPQAGLIAMGQAGRAMVERKFDETLVIDRYEHAIKAALAKKSDC